MAIYEYADIERLEFNGEAIVKFKDMRRDISSGMFRTNRYDSRVEKKKRLDRDRYR